jgi:hypothetical protein
MWHYKGEEFTSADIDDNIGFVYELVDNENGKMYIGKKFFWSTRRLPPLKGKNRKRKVVKESDWKTYMSSSNEVIELFENHGFDRFTRNIIHLCKTRGQLSYMELKEQMDRRVLESDDYYNGIIQCRIHKKHV